MDERLLGRIWRAQRFDRTNLRTSGGDSLEVVYRGRPQRGGGPDFRGAALVVGGEIRHGDVEVHVRSSGWTAHRHDRDHGYDRVILHVVYQEGTDPIRTARGIEVPCLALGLRLEGPATWADLANGSEEECRGRVAALTDASLGERLDWLGDQRLREKAAALEADLAVADPEQVLHERLLEALGYSQNRRPGRELGRRLPIASLYAIAHRRPALERVAISESLLFGVAGLLPSQRGPVVTLDWASEQHAEEVERVWTAFGGEWQPEAMGADCWNLGVRPLNSPQRRLAGLGVLVGAHLEAGLLETVWRELATPDGAAARRLADLFAVEAPDSYWAGYFDFGRPIGPAPVSLIGDMRAREIVVNVVFPLALAFSANGDAKLADAAWGAYRAAPRLAANEVTRWVLAEVLGPERAGVVGSARRQQGLHHLFQTGCDQRRCDDCPLLAARGRTPAPASGT